MRLLTKRTLVAVSHAIEKAALARADDVPMIVMACFQTQEYFEREKHVYNDIAARSAATVIAAVGLDTGETVNGLTLLRVEPDENLARQWVVAALTPRFGAVLVATECDDQDPGVPDQDRVFRGEWHLRRNRALREVVRLRHELRGKLGDDVAFAIDDLVERVRSTAPPPGEARAGAMVDALGER